MINTFLRILLFFSITFSALISFGITPAGISTLNRIGDSHLVTPNVIMGAWLSICAGALLGCAKYILMIIGYNWKTDICFGVSLGITSFVYLGIIFLGTKEDLMICLLILGLAIHYSSIAAEKTANYFLSLA